MDPTVVRIRTAAPEDLPFLERMVAVAAAWREPVPPPVAAVLADPVAARYTAGWPGEGDAGFVADEGGRPVGAAWWRFLPATAPGYGFVDEATPELAVGVVAAARGRGVGRRLVEALLDEARRRRLPGLGLSVAAENPAADLYRSLGFEEVGADGGSRTMVLRL